MPVGDGGDAFDVQDLDARVGNRLAENQLGVRPEGFFDLLVGGLLVDEGHVDAHFPEGGVEEVEGAAVDAGHADHVVPRRADVEAGEEIGRLAGRGQHAGDAALEGCQARGDMVVGRILETGIEIAGGLEVEQFAHLVAGSIFEGCALDDGDLAGFAVAGFVAGLHAKGAEMLLAIHYLTNQFIQMS